MKMVIQVRVFHSNLFSKVMPLLGDLKDLSAIFLLQILSNLIHRFSIRREVTTYFSVFPGRVSGLSYAPLNF